LPSSFLGLFVYAIALFPGIAFLFAREGHRTSARRSVFRETAAVIFVSGIADAIIACLAILVAKSVPPVGKAITCFISNERSFAAHHFDLFTYFVLIFISLSTLLGWGLGTKRAHDWGLKRIWDSSVVDREGSGWSIAFGMADEGDMTKVGIQLKSGIWIQGQLRDFENSNSDDPNRSLVINGAMSIRQAGSSELVPIKGFGTLVIEAKDIEYLLVGYEATDPVASP
jgi:hypothetical protein